MDFRTLLNDEQLKPVLDTEGAVLVLAGAGSGKTRVLTHRIAYLIEKCGVDASNILAITFTNKAAREMRDRISTMVEGADRLTMSTFHSFCAKVLRYHADKLGYTSDYSIYTDSDLDRIFKEIFEKRHIEDNDDKNNCKYHISNAKNLALSPDEYKIEFAGIHDISKYVEVYRMYEAELRRSNAMDFDDLLLNALKLFSKYPEVLRIYSERYRYILVDEFQDTNRTQYELVRLLSAHHHNIFVVGDDDQSIYGWRGADISNILDFRRDYPDVKVYKLERNYRSTPQILEVANSIISANSERTGKTLWTANPQGVKVETYTAISDRAEADYVVERIYDLMRYSGYKASEIAILVRVNSITRGFEEKLNLYNIPYRIYGGFKFFERKEIKDIISYLRLIINPRDDESLRRIINFPKRGIGDSTIDKLVEYRDSTSATDSLFDVILDADSVDTISPATRTKLSNFGALMLDLIKAKEMMDVKSLVKYLIDRVGFLDAYKEDTEDNISRRLNISEFVNAVDEFVKDNESATLRDYMESVSLISDLDSEDTIDRVTISTVHMVKGLEFKVVFVVGMEEGIFPISRAIDDVKEMAEERRVMYVAVTRAMQRLYISWASSRFRFGTVKDSVPSRFLDNVPGFRRPAKLRDEDILSRYRPTYSASDETFEYNKKVGYGQTLQSVATAVPTPSATRPSTSTKDYTKFKAGVKVEHAKFGEGIIVDVRGEGKSCVCKIAFKGLGIKAFTLEVAPITIKG